MAPGRGFVSIDDDYNLMSMLKMIGSLRAGLGNDRSNTDRWAGIEVPATTASDA